MQHSNSYDGQCCITEPDGLLGWAMVLAAMPLCACFLHGQHERTAKHCVHISGRVMDSAALTEKPVTADPFSRWRRTGCC